jgi:hypothetical protein
MVQTFKCPNCGQLLEYQASEETSVHCPSCSNLVAIPVELRTANAVPKTVMSPDTPLLFTTRHALKEKLREKRRAEQDK